MASCKTNAKCTWARRVDGTDGTRELGEGQTNGAGQPGFCTSLRSTAAEIATGTDPLYAAPPPSAGLLGRITPTT
jgi:hypothetical protein